MLVLVVKSWTKMWQSPMITSMSEPKTTQRTCSSTISKRKRLCWNLISSSTIQLILTIKRLSKDRPLHNAETLLSAKMALVWKTTAAWMLFWNNPSMEDSTLPIGAWTTNLPKSTLISHSMALRSQWDACRAWPNTLDL